MQVYTETAQANVVAIVHGILYFLRPSSSDASDFELHGLNLVRLKVRQSYCCRHVPGEVLIDGDIAVWALPEVLPAVCQNALRLSAPICPPPAVLLLCS